MHSTFYWIAVAVVTVVSTARITRLLTIDSFPPLAFFRDLYEARTSESGWQPLAYCAYCMAPWITGWTVLTGWLAGVYGTDPFHHGHDPSQGDFKAWWYFNGIMAASYLAAILVQKDGDDS